MARAKTPFPALGPAEDPIDDEPESIPDGRRIGTVRLRPLIDIAQPRLILTVETEAGMPAGRRVVHEGEVCRIGTQPSNDLVLNDPSVSRFHCRIVPDMQGWKLEDSGSLNGTWMHGMRILGAVIPAESVVSVGQTVIRIVAAESEHQTLVPMMETFGALTGRSKPMRKLFSMMEKVAGSDINCFIYGESGSGKELVAAEIVQRGARADKPFVVVDCGAVSPTLVESELFGHVRGAFTGADRDRIGAFEAADGGTVFLDEIGELPIAVQPKLLRALEQREIRRVGETKTRKVNVRVIAATNRDLEREVNKGTFREDLYFRIAVITVRVPPLRERPDDIYDLIKAFLRQLDAEDSKALFPREVIEELATHEWPGNVRELRNYVERSVVLQAANTSFVTAAEAAPASVMSGARSPDVDVRVPFKVAKDRLVDAFERAYVPAVIEAAGGNMTKAAKMAGIDRMYLHRLVQKQSGQLSSSSELSSEQQRKPVE